MNVHHLELFYYVAKAGGISAAVRLIPYGIQQPAISGQILILEEDLGARLFERKPFRLTTEGVELFAFVRPFFENIEAVGARLRKRSAPQLRIGASELVLRDYLPAITQRLNRDHPDIRLALRSGFQSEIEQWLRERQLDFAVIPLRGRIPRGVQTLPLVRMPLVLLVHKSSKTKSAEELWSRPERGEPLISLPPTESISAHFQRGLKRRGVQWRPTTEASSIELITDYVAKRRGTGVSVAAPAAVRHRSVRALPLEGFDPIEMVAMWHGKPTPVIRLLLEETQHYLAEAWPGGRHA